MRDHARITINVRVNRPGLGPQRYERHMFSENSPEAVAAAAAECVRLVRDGLALEGIDWSDPATHAPVSAPETDFAGYL